MRLAHRKKFITLDNDLISSSEASAYPSSTEVLHLQQLL
jgi:hypothetical protein